MLTGITLSRYKDFPIEYGNELGGRFHANFKIIYIYQLFLNVPSQIHVRCHDRVQPV